MSAEFQSIDEAITASYQNASQVETQARQLEARISKIDGAKRHLPHRNYGQPVDLGKNQGKPDTYQPYCTRFCRAGSLLRY